MLFILFKLLLVYAQKGGSAPLIFKFNVVILLLIIQCILFNHMKLCHIVSTEITLTILGYFYYLVS